jgi:TonB family protein
MRLPILTLLSFATLVAQPSPPIDAHGWLNKGIGDYKSGRYQDAVTDFQNAVNLNPSDLTARLYLATAWMSQYIPGAESPDNLEIAQKAEAEFNHVLQVEPNNVTALASVASLAYQRAQGMPDLDTKLRKLEEAASWYDRLSLADPQNKEAYYSLGVIDWVKWYAGWMHARMDLGMRPEQPGPLPNAEVRQQLKQQYSSTIDHGISNLERALQLDPQYDDAMAYMNLLVRERADLAETPERYQREIEIADQWVEKALQTKKLKMQAAAAQAEPQVQIQAPLPPPPPSNTPQRVRVAAGVQQFNLIHKVDPVYPPLAYQARIQGTVRFTAIIGKDGRVQHLQLVSGHPLLVQAAREAVSQWEYRPTLLNGSPVEVVTMVDVNFTLHD